MSDNHLAALKSKHQNIDIVLNAEENRPFPDDNKIYALKKQKLTLKDQIKRFELQNVRY